MRRRLSKNSIDLILELYKGDPVKTKNHIQALALAYWKEDNKRGCAELATGIGKTKIAIMAILEQFEKNPNSIVFIFVPTITLRDDTWPAELKEWGANHLISKLRILTYNAMAEVVVEGESDLIILDEVHHATINNFQFFATNKVWDILALSATLDDLEQEKADLIDKYCPSFLYLPLEDAITLKLISDFEIITLYFELSNDDIVFKGYNDKGEAQYISEAEEYKRLSKKLQNSMFVAKLKWQKFKNMQARVDMIMNLPSKRILAKEVMDQILDEGKRTIIFCGSIEQCDQLCHPDVYHSKDKSGLKLFREYKTTKLGAVKALNEGQNIPDIDQIFIVQISSKGRDIIQRIGRSVRWRVGHTAKVIILVARGTSDEKWYNNAVKNFDQKRITNYNLKAAVK